MPGYPIINDGRGKIVLPEGINCLDIYFLVDYELMFN